jgi:hypothetical protein
MTKPESLDNLFYVIGLENPPVRAVYKDGHEEQWERAGLILAHNMKDSRAKDVIGWRPLKVEGKEEAGRGNV